MLGQSQTSLFFRTKTESLNSFISTVSIYLCRTKRNALKGMKEIKKGSRIIEERREKGMEKEKDVQQVHRNRHKLPVEKRRSVYDIFSITVASKNQIKQVRHGQIESVLKLSSDSSFFESHLSGTVEQLSGELLPFLHQ